MDLTALLRQEPGLRDLPLEGPGAIALNGVQGSACVPVTAFLCNEFNHKGMLILRQEAGVHEILANYRALFGEDALFLPERELLFDTYSARSHEAENARAEVIKRMARGDYKMIVTTLPAVLLPCDPPAGAEESERTLSVGGEAPPEELEGWLVSHGYTRLEMVEGSGTYARRGGILDLFSPNLPDPVRIEFFGDEIDRIVPFDVISQRALEPMQSVTVCACGNQAAEKERLLPLLRALREKEPHPSIDADIERLEQGLEIAADRYLPLCVAAMTAPFLLHRGLLFIEEYAQQQKVFNFIEWQLAQELERIAEKGGFCADGKYYYSQAEFEAAWNGHTVLLSGITPGQVAPPLGDLRQLHVLEDPIPFYQEDVLTAELRRATDEGYTVCLAGKGSRVEALKKTLSLAGLPLSGKPAPGAVYCAESALTLSLRFPDAKLLLLSEGAQGAPRKARHSAPKAARITSFDDITPGDLVVHVSHGIGVYKGIRKVENQGVTKDYIVIGYDQGDTLFVPCPQLDLISKYMGAAEGQTVKLNRLGGNQWEKTKARVKNQTREIARDLIALYARRLKAEGVPCDADTDWQLRFEEQFPYEETADQVRCTAEIKEDMERPYPMDRLLCGDVGVGKTEVALRAAFKAIDNGMQAAILCPTTILSEQHYLTVRDRFADFPIKAAVLNRFRTPKEIRAILGELESGAIDLIIGTHRLLSADVHFKKLGLLIIDEEQRFGVKHKEKIKELSLGVDVLTMSATPIPRTLNMSLSGIRDLSIIESPPADRQPVTTYVLEYDFDLILAAIAKELKRGGCVFYMKNDISAMERIASALRARLPEARIAVGHGQMNGTELERVWERVLRHEVDILVCTTIIETGVDVAFANTLIIEDADRLGLAQLHQIRGRVGRSSVRAYAYLTYRQGGLPGEVAAKRLSTIREFTEFGSGLKIAMRDLEIRGAGALLGEKQHGQMNVVGYEMYMRILKEAVLEEQGKTDPPESDCAVDVSISAFIPESYVPGEKMRIDLYKKIAAIRSEEDYRDMTDECCDRFSDPPECVLNLMKIALLRATARACGVQEIKQKQEVVLFFVFPQQDETVNRMIKGGKGRVYYSAGGKPYYTLHLRDQHRNLLAEMSAFLRDLQAALPEKE